MDRVVNLWDFIFFEMARANNTLGNAAANQRIRESENQRIREYFDHSADIESDKINLHEVTNSMVEDFQRKPKKFEEELFAIANDETLNPSRKEEAMWKLYDRYSSKEKQQT